MSGVTVALIAPDDPRWAAVLERARHDVYHLPEYVLAAARVECGSPAALYAEYEGAAMLAPLVIRALPSALGAPSDWKDASSPYGYGGPIATVGTPVAAVERMAAAIRCAAADHSLVAVFLRLHPLRGVPPHTLASLGTLVRHESVVYIDLAKSREALRAETRSNHRRNIVRLLRDGFVAESDDWTAYEDFQHVYHATMRRHDAASFYFFSDSYFDDLRRSLGDQLHLITVRAPHGDVASAGLFTTVDGVVEYHLGGTLDEYLSIAPSKLMFDFARDWAKDRGAAVLNLGGGIGAQAGPLLHFKAGFSTTRADFHTCRVTVDETRYASLERAYRELPASNPPGAGFFPAYRAL